MNESDVKNHIQHTSNEKIRILQISDLHLFSDPTSSALHRRRKADEVVQDISKLCQQWWDAYKHNLEEMPSFDGLIVSGDLVDALKIGRYTDPNSSNTEVQAVSHQFVCDVIIDTLQKILKDSHVIPERSSCMIIPGNHDILRTERSNHEKGIKLEGRIRGYFENVNRIFTSASPGENIDDYFGSPVVSMIGDPDRGIVVLIGLDSNQNAYLYDEDLYDYGLVQVTQMKRLKNFLQVLGNRLPNTPIYPVVTLHHHLLSVEKLEQKTSLGLRDVMSSVVLDGRNVIEELSRSRISLATHGHMHESIIQRVAYWDFSRRSGRKKGAPPPLLHVVGCPSLYRSEGDDDHALGGGLILDIDLDRGTSRVDVLDNSFEEMTSTTVVFPLVSASRVSPAEMRVYKRLCEWTESKNPSDGFPFVSKALPEKSILFKHAREMMWSEYGYALLGSIPKLPSRNDQLQKNMEEILKGGVDLPVDKNDPNIPEKSYRLLIALMYDENQEPYILLNNQIPLRETSYGAWDSLLLPAFKNINELLKNLRNDLNRIHDNLVIQEISETSEDHKRFSGVKKALSSLPSTTDRALQDELIDFGSREFYKFSPVDGQPQRYNMTISAFPRFSYSQDDSKSLSSAISHLKKITPHHVFRWEPNKEDKESDNGFVWFPINHWRSCPALIARNADILHWIEQEISSKDPRTHASWLICGHGGDKQTNLGISDIDIRPFSDTTLLSSNHEFPSSLSSGLKKVTYNPNRELKNEYPYSNTIPTTVFLNRVTDQDGSNRDRISVSIKDKKGEKVLCGYLRPVQRYVLRNGLERAKTLEKACQSLKGVSTKNLGDKDIGYLILNRHIGSSIALLPPVLESLPTSEKDSPRSPLDEFIVCDGNHRVVQYCWNDRSEVQCVLLKGTIPYPYYAYPFSSWDWHVTASNILESAPEQYGKYTPRRPSLHDDKNEVEYWRGQWFRRFYRDFSMGFEHLGNQGGTR